MSWSKKRKIPVVSVRGKTALSPQYLQGQELLSTWQKNLKIPRPSPRASHHSRQTVKCLELVHSGSHLVTESLMFILASQGTVPVLLEGKSWWKLLPIASTSRSYCKCVISNVLLGSWAKTKAEKYNSIKAKISFTIDSCESRVRTLIHTTEMCGAGCGRFGDWLLDCLEDFQELCSLH